MSASAVDAKAVTAALTAEGLHVSPDEERFSWALSFEVLAREQAAVLVLPPGAEYFIALASIRSPKLAGPFETLSIETLRTIIKLQSTNNNLLAKFDVVSTSNFTLYIAISPCSVVNWDGTKLRKRLHACAELAAQIRLSLQEPPVDQ
jgi:hypothetical protein